jgi:AcrR family transcriptional regulator
MDAIHRGRPKLAPDPQVRAAILAAALAIVHEEGIGALGISRVLARTQMSTRAFYRHFDSKDELVKAMFLELAHIEMEPLQKRMADEWPVRAVAAWIDGRLDLAFDQQVKSESRHLSLEAYSQAVASPELVGPAYAVILRPLIDQIDRGTRLGLFANGDPAAEAMSIHGVVWATVERHWATGADGLNDVRNRVIRFCLRGLGVAADVIDEAISGEGSRGWKPLSHNKALNQNATPYLKNVDLGLAIDQTPGGEGTLVRIHTHGL